MRQSCSSFLLLISLLICSSAFAQSARPSGAGGEVYLIPVKGMIDLGVARFIERGIREAEEAQSKLIIFDIKTFGGRLDAAVVIKDAIMATSLDTVGYINPRAISAGALIALSTDHIIVHPGGSIGAATPVMLTSAGETSPASEKEKSYVRAVFKSTAQEAGHSTLLAEAMVDEDVELVLTQKDGTRVILKSEEAKEQNLKVIKTVIKRGKLLTLTAEESIEVELAEAKAESISSILDIYKLGHAIVKEVRPNWAENLVRGLTHPVVASMLLTLGFMGLLLELYTPNWGIAGSIGILCLALFFGGKYLYGLANVGDILLFGIGLVLLILELFVIPGFGIAGISGIICLVAGVYLAFVAYPLPRYSWDVARTKDALYSIGISFIIVFGAFLISLRYMPKIKPLRRLILGYEEKASEGFSAPNPEILTAGKKGKSLTPLRPSGKALIDGRIVDVVTEGDFIPKNKDIKVVRVEGVRVIVTTEDGRNG
ncbi:MAG TPA: nodulation protein NfeD [Candidatus Omnitrophica bacterium]|nr:nodulation protein NfeD [Candidatus Omnitrophota bacterium]